MSYKELRKKISSVLVFALLFGMLAPAMALGAEAVKLKDIADSYAKVEIQALVDAGIVSGYEDGSFQPTKAMTRAELAKIIVLALGKKENPDKAASFTDVDKNSWYRGYVGALVEAGITQGTSDTTFAPNANVTREELVVFFVRAMGLEETAKKVTADAKLSDLAQVSSWAQAHVSLAFKMGFVQGIENKDGTLSFNPKANAERQALARLAYEFKTNKAKFVEKATAVAKAEEKPSTGGTAGTGGGASGGGGGGGSSSELTTMQRLNSGGVINDNVTLYAGMYGPASGITKVNGTLTLDPGATGEVTLRNIEATNIVIASGASSSVHLSNIKVTFKLVVNAANQSAAVRVVAEGTTSVGQTEIYSKAIIQSATTGTGTGFGGITINPTSANQNVTLEGTITGTVKVTGSQSVSLNVYGSVGTISVEAPVTITANAGATIGTVQLDSANANVSLQGSGVIQTVVAAVANAVLNILDSSTQIQKLKINVKIKLQGDKDKIKDIPMEVPSGSNLTDLIDSVIPGILDIVKMAIAKNDLSISFNGSDTADSVTNNLKTLPASSTNGTTVTWKSSNASVISNDGLVYRPAAGQPDAVVTLTATISLGTLQTTKEFKLTVKAYPANTPVSSAPTVANVHPVNYAQGTDEVHVLGIVASSKVRVYDANNKELGSAISQLRTTDSQLFAGVLISGGFGADVTKVYATAQEDGKQESTKVEVAVPSIPDAPAGVSVDKANNGDVVVTIPNAAGKQALVYTTADSRQNLMVTGSLSGTTLTITIPANNLSGVTNLYIAFLVNGGESQRVLKSIPTGGGSNPADTTAPTTVTGLTYTARTTSSVTLQWNAATDNSNGTVSYVVYAGSSNKGTVTATTYTVNGLNAGTNYSFSVYSVDPSGNVSAAASITVATLSISVPDTTAPSTVTGLTYGNLSATALRLSWIASTDASNSVTYAVYKGNTKLADVSSLQYDVVGLTAGTGYTFSVYALDPSGNVSVAGTITLTTSVTLSVYGVRSSGNASVTSNVYALNNSSGAYDNSSYASNNYLVIQFSDVLASDQVNGTINLNGATVTGLSGVTTSVYNSVYLVVYSPSGFTQGAISTLNISNITKTVNLATYGVDPIEVKVKE